MIKKLLLAAALCFVPSVALADPPPATYTAVTTTSVINVKTTSGLFYGVLAIATQTTAVTCWDSPTNSGQIIFVATPVPSGSSVLNALGSGLRFFNGLTCQISTSIVAPGYLILWN